MHKGTFERQGGRGQLVQIGRVGQGKIVGTDIGTHVVDHDEQDIFGGGGACGEEGGEEEEEEEESHRVVRRPGQGTDLFAAYAGSFCLAHALQCLCDGRACETGSSCVSFVFIYLMSCLLNRFEMTPAPVRDFHY